MRASVVTGFLTKNQKILLLRRSSKVGTYKGQWAGVSGYIEVDEAEQQAWTELDEELGIKPENAKLEVAGDPLEIADNPSGRIWLVHPFRFSLADNVEPRLDWEHVEMRWISPKQMREMETVPGLWEAWSKVSNGF
ncbi:MAG: NUDIX pyrophosphatase [Proteobacteria bacterium]|nr:NUDIX pyrophosphatase [Pseudomonadota bacterium]